MTFAITKSLYMSILYVKMVQIFVTVQTIIDLIVSYLKLFFIAPLKNLSLIQLRGYLAKENTLKRDFSITAFLPNQSYMILWLYDQNLRACKQPKIFTLHSNCCDISLSVVIKHICFPFVRFNSFHITSNDSEWVIFFGIK